MKRSTTSTIVTTALSMAALVFVSGCAKSSDSGSDQPAPPASAPDDATGMVPEMPSATLASFESEQVEVGCGMCIYEMDGVDHCEPAVAIAGKHFLVTGSDVDAHALCSEAKMAVVSGKIEDGTFVATAVEIQ